MLMLALAFATAAELDLEFSYDGYEIDVENARFGLDLEFTGGYPIPLNENGKPGEKSIAENYDMTVPNIGVFAGLGAYAEPDSETREACFGLGVEYRRTVFGGDDRDFTINSFGLVRRLSIYPKDFIALNSSKGSGLFFMNADPDTDVTMTFADYTTDRDARTGSVHITDMQSIGLGFAVGRERPFAQLDIGARMDTYYPRYLFWKELVRGIVYTSVEGGFNSLAEETDVRALTLVGDAAVMAMEIFNLNFYPESVGETHQHIVSPSATLTIHF